MASDIAASTKGRPAAIVGAGGFVGRHLAPHLASLGLRVYGIDAVVPAEAVPGVSGMFEADALDESALARCLDATRPDYVFHLAAERPAAATARSLGANAAMTYNVLRCASRLGALKAVVVAGSAAEYGRAPLDSGSIDEGAELRPVSLYGVSKVGQWHTARWLAVALGVPVVYTRTFNLVGPGEPTSLVSAALAEQLAQIRSGSQPGPLVVRSPDHVRDFLDVRDAVRAYWLCAHGATPACPVVNVCSGWGTSIRDVARELIAASGAPVCTREKPSEAPDCDVPWQVGSHVALTALTGWRPTIALADSLKAVFHEQSIRPNA